MQKCDNEHFSKKLYQFLGVITRSLTIKIIFNYIISDLIRLTLGHIFSIIVN